MALADHPIALGAVDKTFAPQRLNAVPILSSHGT
jgi:hypothetical protein